MQEEKTTLEGMIESVIFHNEENGYTVFALTPPDNDSEEITCTGYLSNPLSGESIKIIGTYTVNPKYGRQFAFTGAERVQPTTLDGIRKYLASGVIKGVGEVTAKTIVSRFKDKTFDIIENDPEKLSRIKGISLKKALQISESFHAQYDQRRVMLFLQELGISAGASMKIYKKYKEDTIELVKINPYRLADDIDGIGFKTADAIAHRMGIARDSAERISAGVRFCLWEATSEGHTYMPTSLLLRQSAALLRCEPAAVENQLAAMQMERLIMRENLDGEPEPLVFTSAFYYAELKVARQLVALNAAHSKPTPNSEKTIAAIEQETGLTLSDSQRNAVLQAVTHGVFVLTGGPGTGKTTVINTIIGLFEQSGMKVTLTAPTGRAAKRMSEATGREAKTIHRLLEVKFVSENSRRQAFNINEDNPLETDVLIADESSMIDILLMKSLLDAVAEGTRVILVGDIDQLPSVGAGNVLKDIINSNCLPVARLTEIFRQAAESAIITNAHRINKGEYPAINDKEKDFFFMRRDNAEDAIQTLLDLVTTRLPAYKDLNPLTDIQILTPMRKSTLGVTHLNAVLQATLNPPSPKKREREYGAAIFREGDKVMQIRNNYDATWESPTDFGEGIFNGDMGIIHSITDDNITVIFDDNRRVKYDFTQLDELEPAYAITVHKSQGSEYRAVIIPLLSGPQMLLTRNLLYTAVTRAKELAIIVGIPETMHRCIDNDSIAMRYTALSRRISSIANA